MSKGNGYVCIDKNLIQELNNLGRPFTRLEAMFSFSVDQDNNKNGTINGYAKLWGWSRNKTRKFLKEIRTPEGHQKDTRRTPEGHPIHFIDRGLWDNKDTRRTPEGHQKDTRRDTTIDPNPNPNPKKKKKNIKKKTFVTPFLGQFQNVKLTAEELEKLKSQFGESGCMDRIDNLSGYLASKGDKYKSHYATILVWERKNKKRDLTPKSVYQSEMAKRDLLAMAYLQEEVQNEGKSGRPQEVVDIENSSEATHTATLPLPRKRKNS